MANSAAGLKPVLKGLAMLAVFGALVALARALGLEQHLDDKQWLLAHVEGQGVVGVLFFLGFTGLVTGMGLPRQLTAFLGGYAFGWFWGSILATLGTMLGCAMDFGLARTLGRDFVKHRFGRRVASLDAFLRSDPWRSALAIRLFPVGHNMLTNVAAGVTSIPAAAFILSSGLGYLPQNLVFAIFGAGVNAQTTLGKALSIGLSVLLLAAATWLGVSVYRAYKRKGAVPVEDDGEDGSGAERVEPSAK
ncbi:MAG TPA: VTT domain-containing protein [Humidesulfovibrio sp.]|uniref:TVP38/TMEM64 family protein n=1 Tax=Humidesulfovibrio sp. TaxID=2910988 RepID=UPI002D05F4BE|nr:VTT domain-containing protein [Humidesulfovibrio sp.]HWR02678.1 VTT domain-containing protein [Humidesulfovibrio sp.]